MFYLGGVLSGKCCGQPLTAVDAEKYSKIDTALSAIAMLILVFSMFQPISLSTRKICIAILLATMPIHMLVRACGGPPVYENYFSNALVIPIAF